VRRRVTLLLAAALLCSSSSPAFAQPVPGEEIAKKAFEDGVALEKKGNYEGALAKFNESRQIKETLGNRFHTAFCLEMTGQLAAALAEYEALDVAAHEQKKAEVIEQTRVRLEALRPRVPQITVKLQPIPKDAEVLVDGKVVKPPLLVGTAFRIDPGDHTVTAHAPEHEKFTKKVSIAEGASLSVDVVLEKSSAANVKGPLPAEKGTNFTEPPHEPPRPAPKTAAIVSTVVAGVLGAGGVVSFVLAGSAQEDAKAECPSKRSCTDEQDKVRLLDTLALTGFVGAGVVGVLAVVLWVSKPPQGASGASATTTTTTAKLVTRGSWIGLEGRF
jgi:hypothetical protein